MKVFTHTIYRIPTVDELKEFQNHPELTPKEILNEFGYTLIGRGILDSRIKSQIIESITNLCELFPEDKRYKEALTLASELESHHIKESEEIPLFVARNDNTYIGVPSFVEYKNSKNVGLDYLTEDENLAVDEAIKIFENEYDGDITKLDEAFFSKLFGGIAGFLAGPTIGKVIAKALGVEKGVLYDMFTSRLVGTALGSAIAKHIAENKGKMK